MSESRSSSNYSSKIKSKKSSDEILGELFSSFRPEDGEAEEGEMSSASSPSGSEEESAHKRAKKAKKAKKEKKKKKKKDKDKDRSDKKRKHRSPERKARPLSPPAKPGGLQSSLDEWDISGKPPSRDHHRSSYDDSSYGRGMHADREIKEERDHHRRSDNDRHHDREGEECDRARKAAQKASLEASMEPAKAGSSRGPMVGPQVETPNSFLMTVKKAPTSGTRWHNPPGTKKWNEAQTDEGHIYYWNIDTNESRWDSPPEGYSSIIEQRNEQNARDRPPEEIPLPEPQIRGLELPQVSAEEEEQRRVKLVQKKLLEEKMEKLVGQNKKVAGPQAFPSSTTMEYRKQQALPLKKKTTGANSVAIPPPNSVTQFGNKTEGPVARGQPFGAWQTIEKRVEPAPVDYMVPQVKEGPQANVTLHSDRMTKFTEKVTPSLGGASTSDSTTTFSKPKIVFNRKRKINDDHQKNIRKREDE